MAIFSSKKQDEEKKKGKTQTSSTNAVKEDKKADKPVKTRKTAQSETKSDKKTDKKAIFKGNADGSYEILLLRPLITEKAALVTSSSTYVFEIPMRATKHDVMTAMHEHYKVTPTKINIVRIAPRKKILRARRNRMGTQRGIKKAYVYLKKGEHIEIM